MVSIVLFIGLAFAATLPSMILARAYLHTRGVAVAFADTVPKFMEIAPGWLKGVLITLNFTLMGTALWVLFTYAL